MRVSMGKWACCGQLCLEINMILSMRHLLKPGCIVCHLISVPGCDVKSLGQNGQCSLVSKTSFH